MPEHVFERGSGVDQFPCQMHIIGFGQAHVIHRVRADFHAAFSSIARNSAAFSSLPAGRPSSCHREARPTEPDTMNQLARMPRFSSPLRHLFFPDL